LYIEGYEQYYIYLSVPGPYYSSVQSVYIDLCYDTVDLPQSMVGVCYIYVSGIVTMYSFSHV